MKKPEVYRFLNKLRGELVAKQRQEAMQVEAQVARMQLAHADKVCEAKQQHFLQRSRALAQGSPAKQLVHGMLLVQRALGVLPLVAGCS